MVEKNLYTDVIEEKYFSDIINLLYSMRRWKRNHSLLTEYFLQEFSSHPDRLIKIIGIIRSELEGNKANKQEKMSRRYLYIFSFLCERFGLYEEKLELDDICFSITNPKAYKNIKKELEEYQKKSQNVIQEIFNIFDQKLTEYWIEAEVRGRYKSILSIYEKCRKNKLSDIFALNDIFAFRIIVDSEPEKCFDILNILHDSFIPIPKRYKDYITIPKINGYQSIHSWLLWVVPSLDLVIEVQIRTKFMDDIAESGIAAHFLYAKEKSSKMITEKEQKLLSHMERVTESIQKNQYIYCLTPLWDIIRLQRWSTVIDFADRIHSRLAKKARKGFVNWVKQPLDYVLKDFDSIEIITK